MKEQTKIPYKHPSVTLRTKHGSNISDRGDSRGGELHKCPSPGLSLKQWLKISSHELLEQLSFLGSEKEIPVLEQFCLCESDAPEAICVHMCIFTRSPLPTY